MSLNGFDWWIYFSKLLSCILQQGFPWLKGSSCKDLFVLNFLAVIYVMFLYQKRQTPTVLNSLRLLIVFLLCSHCSFYFLFVNLRSFSPVFPHREAVIFGFLSSFEPSIYLIFSVPLPVLQHSFSTEDNSTESIHDVSH